MPQVQEGYSLTHCYRFFRKKNKDRGKHFENVTHRLYRDVAHEFNKMLIAEALQGGAGVKLPFNMGTLWVKKSKISWNRPPINIHETLKAGKPVYFTNTHSDNFLAGWTWSKRINMLKNLKYYSFKITWSNSKALSEIMLQPGGHKRFLTSNFK